MTVRDTFAVGALRIDALSDGTYPRMLENLFVGARTEEWLRAAGLTDPNETVPFNMGTFLVRGDGRVVLVDTGVGGPFRRPAGGASWGELLSRLGEIGVRPGDIDTVMHTHLHWDHCGWDVNDSEGGATTFPNARVYVAQAEIDYWLGPSIDVDESVQRSRSRITPLLERGMVNAFDGECAVTPSLTMVPTPGHTPGHCSVLAVSRGEHLIIAGDAAYHPAHFEHPTWVPAIDVDPTQTERSRHRLMALATETGALVTCSHMPLLTLGRIRRVESGYAWDPAEAAPFPG